MPAQDTDRQFNRDDEIKPGNPPRSAHEPSGSEGSTRNDKTMTDPGTGAPQDGAPEPNPAGAGRRDNLDR